MRKVIILFLIPVLLCCFSCKNRTKDNVTIPVIDIEKAMKHLSKEKMNFSEFIDSITYVPLETNDSNLISSSNGFAVINTTANYIFHGTLMFGRDGHFVRKLGKTGQGPGEYTLALCTKADEGRKEFYVYSNDSRKIYIYDFENQFIRNVPVRYPGFRTFMLLENGNILLERDSWVYEGFNDYQVIDNKTGAILYKRENITINKDYNEKELIPNSFWRFNNEIYYFENLTDTIFRLNKNGEITSPRFVIKLGKYGNRDKDSDSDNKLLRIGGIHECSEFLFFSILFKQCELYYAAYNKKTGEVRMNKYDRFFNNDIDGGFLWLFQETQDSKLGFNDVLPSLAKERIDLLSTQSNGYDQARNQKLRHFIDDLDEDDNYFFCFFHLK